MKTRDNSGFTLVEVLIAMAIIGVTAVVLLDQRITIVQDAGKARDKRTVWVLASQRLAELELDKSLWVGLGSQNIGDFSDVDPEYAMFTWEYQIVRETIQTGAASEVTKDDSKKKELYRLTLTVRAPGVDDPIILEGEFSTEPPPTDTPDPAKGDPGTGASKPSDPSTPPPSGGLQK
ncbi:MAG TPA: type II secretion system protein [Planctomycetota bacterium]|nr:type II secretion system protein [Planctomycetota bacterium]